MAAFLNDRMIRHRDDVKRSPTVRDLTKVRFERAVAAVQGFGISAPFSAADIDSAVAAHVAGIEHRIRNEDSEFSNLEAALIPRLAELAIRGLMKRYAGFLPSTGVVIGGYGTGDYFPAFEVYRCYGFLDDHFLAVRQDESQRMDRDTLAVMTPFATTSMISAFQSGISPDVHQNVREATRKGFQAFAERLQEKIGVSDPVEQLDEFIEEAIEDHQRKWCEPIIDDHHVPLTRVIASLAVPEMAALAKSLIELQSLKERVTRPSESVGGAVDVAAISKHDGFVWIERKHYFRPDLNPRFLSRQHASRATA